MNDDAAAGGRVIGRYTLYGEIASGGMATVHFGRLSGPVGFSRTVAIKRLHAHFAKDPEFVSMFLDEARLAARVRHPNVVPTLDVVAAEGELFLVMEYVQGENLAHLVRAMNRRGGLVPWRITAAIVAGALHGLHAAHEATDEHGGPLQLVHRDMSPHNVLVGSDGLARVLDFGVAKAAGRLQTTRDGRLKGKFAYMAPEQILRGAVTRRTDVFASAIVLWETLTGHRLFHGETEADVMNAVLSSTIEPPSAVVPALGDMFDAVTMRGLEHESDERFATAREMAIALERCGGIATPSEVGDWLETIPGEALGKRAATVAEIENVSGPRPSQAQIAAALGDAPKRAPRETEEPTVVLQREAPAAPMVDDTKTTDIDVKATKRGRLAMGIAAAAVPILVALVAVASFRNEKSPTFLPSQEPIATPSDAKTPIDANALEPETRPVAIAPALDAARADVVVKIPKQPPFKPPPSPTSCVSSWVDKEGKVHYNTDACTHGPSSSH